jgi:hypothetical protein
MTCNGFLIIGNKKATTITGGRFRYFLRYKIMTKQSERVYSYKKMAVVFSLHATT